MKNKLLQIVFTIVPIFVYSQVIVEWTGLGADNNRTTVRNWSGGTLPGKLDTFLTTLGLFMILSPRKVQASSDGPTLPDEL